MSVIGVVGGGQLARMMIGPALEMGVDLRVLAESEAASARLAASAVGDYREVEVVLDFAREVDVLSFDHELVPDEVLAELRRAGVNLQPTPEALRFAQDKLAMRRRLAELNIPQPAWQAVHSGGELDAFIRQHGGSAVVKTPRGGYDGKGVRRVSAASEVSQWFGHGELLAEAVVGFDRELAQLFARRPSGEIRLWPLVETVQSDGVCVEVIAPAPSLHSAISARAEAIAHQLADALAITGVCAIELFATDAGELWVNELAMRPHNSGHWSQDGSRTGQFEQHLRAVANLPLGDTGLIWPVSVMRNIFGGTHDLDRSAAEVMERYPAAKIHLYGKPARPGRKLGHVNLVGTDLAQLRAASAEIAQLFG